MIINGRKVSNAEIEVIKSQFGMTAQVTIPSGTYWYDNISGLRGMQGGPASGPIWPGLNSGGTLQANASGGGTQVFINGREIHPREVEYLKGLFGYVLQGRYWLSPMGIGGYEGGPPRNPNQPDSNLISKPATGPEIPNTEKILPFAERATP